MLEYPVIRRAIIVYPAACRYLTLLSYRSQPEHAELGQILDTSPVTRLGTMAGTLAPSDEYVALAITLLDSLNGDPNCLSIFALPTPQADVS